ncbi:Imm42 family immunity protein [Pseudomonas frederiksbergensis]|jgi:hypothetical protein|uniref:Uncharacterized protein n=1 Tax=Pseudomonas frederiksbergensis TaxID=104087 RepID=A0A0B1Z344_9PSED|nr:Imm42 family immunity protein [Pseudomonas frederiksbergensis]KHK63733.1 hypothetical protein JZ00_15960 [Pseudomonas frederiksbergensis]
MIYGDPFVFSLQFDVVEEWTDSSCFWKNGLFSMLVDGERLLDCIDVVELRTAVNFYANMQFDWSVTGDATISAAELFRTAHGHFFEGDLAPPKGVQDMTCTVLGDSGLFVYFQKTEQSDRLVWSYDFGKVVYEKLLPVGTIIGVVERIVEM